MAIDDGVAVSYEALSPGVPVWASDETQVGTLHRVLDNAREHIFDGIEVDRRDGVRIFVDAPEVARTAEGGVTLNVSPAEVDAYPAHASGGFTTGAADRATGGLLGRLFRR